MRLVQILREQWHSVVRLLPERWQALIHELAKFGTIGVINLVVNVAVFNLLAFVVLQNGEVKAKVIAVMVAMTSAYFMNRHWTYRDRPKSTLRREYTLFLFFNVVGLFIETTVLYIAKYGLHQNGFWMLNLFGAIGIVLGTIFRFWSYRTHVFKLAPAAEPTAVLAPPAPELAFTVRADEVSGESVVSDKQLHDELTQIELEAIVKRAKQPHRQRQRVRLN